MKWSCWTWKEDRANISDQFFFLNYLVKSKTELVDLESIYIQGQILKHSPLYIGRRFWTGGL